MGETEAYMLRLISCIQWKFGYPVFIGLEQYLRGWLPDKPNITDIIGKLQLKPLRSTRITQLPLFSSTVLKMFSNTITVQLTMYYVVRILKRKTVSGYLNG